jgi:1-acyl-sn-glycerol-3-phosphate acyltransferase
MRTAQLAWLVGRPTIGMLVRIFAPLRVYGTDRIPRHGPVVFCCNHFSWLDPWAIGCAVPRTIHYVAKQEAHQHWAMGPLIRIFGTSSVRRGESDREAIRIMRDVVRRGDALGMFPEGTRQKREPGPVRTGAALIAVSEEVPIVCAAIHGTQDWQLGNFRPVSVAFGEPLDVRHHPKNSQGYRAASEEIQHELRRLWEFLVSMHELGRPRVAVPPA